MNNEKFEKKNILVTGGTAGIGLGISKMLNEYNVHLTITGRNESKLNNISKEFKSANKNFNKAILADISKINDITNLVQNLDILDGIVLNAGIIDYTPVKLISEKKVLNLFSTNVFSNFFLLQKLLQLKKINKGASIVIISSIAAKVGVPGTSIYAASKGALNSYAKVLASELSLQKVRVNVVSPGVINTDLIENTKVTSDLQMKNLATKYPLGLGEISDIVNLVLFLLSENSRWMTGSNIDIEGGYLLNN